MDFDGPTHRGKDDAVARARAAREQRAEQVTNRSDQRKVDAATRIQASACRLLLRLQARPALRAEWRCPASPSNGQQLAVSLWLLRFFDPAHDGVALGTLCRTIVAGMEQDEPSLAFAAAGLRRELALRWVDTLRRLLLACARLLAAQDEPVRRQAGNASGSKGACTKELSGRFGPVLRLLLLVGDPAAWRLTQRLSASPAGQPAAGALTLMAQSALQGAIAQLIAASAGFVGAVHSQLDPALLGAVIKVVSRPLQTGQPPDAVVVQSLVFDLLAVPAPPACQ